MYLTTANAGEISLMSLIPITRIYDNRNSHVAHFQLCLIYKPETPKLFDLSEQSTEPTNSSNGVES